MLHASNFSWNQRSWTLCTHTLTHTLGQLWSPTCQWSDWRLAGPRLDTEWKAWPHHEGTGERGRLWAGLRCDLIKRGQTGQICWMSASKLLVCMGVHVSVCRIYMEPMSTASRFPNYRSARSEHACLGRPACSACGDAPELLWNSSMDDWQHTVHFVFLVCWTVSQ